MIVIYFRIYLISSRIARSEAMSKPSVDTALTDQRMSLTPTVNSEAAPARKDSRTVPSQPMLAAVTSSSQLDDTTCNGRTLASTPGNGESSRRSRAFSVAEFIPAVRRRSTMFFEQRVRLFNKSRFGKMSSHERKATKTLGVIMGAFTACWLPFFILALIKPFCYDQESCIPQWLSSLFLWLGYANSLLNPIIYARFNRDFRTPFKHLLQCHIRDINVRMRTENYTEQYGAGAMAVGPRSSVAGADWLQQPRNSMTSAADVIVRVQCPSNRLTAVTDTM